MAYIKTKPNTKTVPRKLNQTNTELEKNDYKKKIEELDKEISKLKIENEKVRKIRENYETLNLKIQNDIREFNKKKETELKKFEKYKEDETKKLIKERKQIISEQKQ